MPIHDFVCGCGNQFERYQAIDALHAEESCGQCGAMAVKAFLTPPMGFVQPDICYDSPIDGRPITTKHARLDDLARHNCQPYDPEMKKDAARFRKASEHALEKAVDETVEAEFERMPIRKKEQLAAELEGGMTVEPMRTTAPAKPILTELHHG